MRPLDLLAARLRERDLLVSRHGDQLVARCPAHDDRNASLSVGVGHDDRALVCCHTGCETVDVLDALGLAFADLFIEAPKPWTNAGLRRTGATLDRDGRAQLGGTRYMPGAAKGERKALAAKGQPRDLWPDPATVEGEVLFVVEGEPDAVTGATLDLPTVAVPGATKWRPEWAARLAQGRERVVVIADADDPGREAAQRTAAAVAEHCPDVRLLDLTPERTDGYDLSDYAASARDDERAQAADLLMRTAELAPAASGRAEPETCERYAARRIDLAAVDADEDVPWRCDRLAADGYVSVIAGKGGDGKTWLALGLASGVHRGATVAGIDCRKGKALIFDAESGPKLLKRRLRDADLPTSTITYYDADGLSLRNGDDLLWLEERIRAEGANLVIIDSLARLCPGADEDRSKDMVPIMAGLARIARATSAALIVIHHRGKGESGYRGSSGIRDQADMLFVLDRDGEDRRVRTVRAQKFRLDVEPPTCAFTLDTVSGDVTLDGADLPEPKAPPTIGRGLRAQVVEAVTREMGTTEIAEVVGIGDPQDSTFKRALAEAAKAGEIARIRRGRYGPGEMSKVSGLGNELTDLSAERGSEAA